MQCTRCNYPETRVAQTDTDDQRNLIYRRRECLKCGTRFNTQESLREAQKRGRPFKTSLPNRPLPQ